MKILKMYAKLIISISLITANIGFLIPYLIVSHTIESAVLAILDMVISIPITAYLGVWIMKAFDPDEFTVFDYLEMIKFKIFDGSKYNWKCYGSSACCYSHVTYDSSQDFEYEFCAVFDTLTKVVYELSLHVDRSTYLWIHPSYKEAYLSELKEKEASLNELLPIPADDRPEVYIDTINEFKKVLSAHTRGML